MEPAVIVGYVVAKLLGRGKKFADAKVDDLLDRLYARVWQGLGGGKALERLAGDPGNTVAQEWATASVAAAADDDPRFRRDLAALQDALGKAAPNLLISAPGAHTVVGVNQGYFIQDSSLTIHHHDGSGADDFADAPAALKVLTVVAVMLCVGGIGLFGYTLFTDRPALGDPDFGQMPEGIPIAAAVFFAGFVLAGVASLATAMRRRRS